MEKQLIAKSLETPIGIVFEDEDHIHVAGPVFREGVFNGALQEFSDFEPDIPKLKGLKYVRGEHPKDDQGNFRPVQDTDDIIGSLIDAQAMPDKKLAWGIWDLNKKLLSAEEIEAIHQGKAVGTSPGYWCDEQKLGKPEIYAPTGEIYYKKEKGPRLFDHIASPKRPACKTCGPLHAQAKGGDILAEGTEDKFPDICFKKFIVQGLWSDDELKKMIGETLALDPMKEDRQSAMQKLLTQILVGLDAAPLKIQSEVNMPDEKIDLKLLVQSEEFKEVLATATAAAIKEPLAKLTEAETKLADQTKLFEAQKAQLEAQKVEVESLKAAEAKRVEEANKSLAEQAAAKIASLKEEFKSWLKPGKETEADALFEQAKGNIFEFRIRNPGHFVVQSETQARYSPTGSTKAEGGSAPETITRPDGMIVKSDTGEFDWKAMGIKSPEDLMKELQIGQNKGGA